MRVLSLLVVGALVAPAARADHGEVSFDAIVAGEAAWLVHPSVHEPLASPFSSTASFTFLPRLGGGLRYALTDELCAGVAVEAAAIPNLTATGVSVKNTTGDLLTGGYLEVALPLSLGWRLDSGHDVSGVVELAGGPLVSLWSGNALGDPTRPDANGLPSRLPVELEDAWRLGGVVRLSAAVEARFFDVIVVTLAPSASASWAGTLGVHAGLSLTPSFVAGVGPL